MKNKAILLVLGLVLIIALVVTYVWFISRDDDGSIPQGNQFIEDSEGALLSYNITSDFLGEAEADDPIANYSEILIEGGNFEIIGFSPVEDGKRRGGGCIFTVYDRYVLFEGNYYFLESGFESEALLSMLSPTNVEDYISYVSAMEKVFPPSCGIGKPLIYLETHYFEPYRELDPCAYDPIDIKGGLDDGVFSYYRETSTMSYSVSKTSIINDNGSYSVEFERVYECEEVGTKY